ncbi:MAG: NAD-dependent epimerase/dehydratase family protein, partial [Paracoccaceae bacterium]
MKILALGSTGAIGSQLVSILAKDPSHEIYITSRSPRQDQGVVRYFQGNALNQTFLNNILQQHWDVIVDFMVYDTPTFESRIAALLSATEQYIFISSARVFANSDKPITEKSSQLLDVSDDEDFLASDEYALTKARQEELLTSSSRNNWTIVRPYITFGKGRLQLGTLEKESWLYRAIQGRSIVFCQDLMDKRTTLTDGAIVADMIANLIGQPKAIGEDFNLTGPDTTHWGAVVDLYCNGLEHYLGQRPKLVLQDLKTFCDGAPSIAQVKYDRIFHREFDPSKIGQFVELHGLEPALGSLRYWLDDQ